MERKSAQMRAAIALDFLGYFGFTNLSFSYKAAQISQFLNIMTFYFITFVRFLPFKGRKLTKI